ncbi:MAGE-domain-containing protein [Violaceomyces palustris]|uniref:MAGE-domain-containing protein n=1 Tax=Violaceomyces palustris TaxID=1673888 RepID=A0ACD0NZV8_9BASI|nr:MAGE-domain-containing protein [Violaceomyces palustris]
MPPRQTRSNVANSSRNVQPNTSSSSSNRANSTDTRSKARRQQHEAARNERDSEGEEDQVQDGGNHEDEEDEDEEEEEEEDPDEGSEADQDPINDRPNAVKMKTMLETEQAKKAAEVVGESNINRKANDLVRLALFSEYRKIPIRKDDISRKVLGKESTRAFPVVFNLAQRILHETFGYHMVELRAKGAENEQLVHQSNAAVAQAEEEERKRKRKSREKEKDKASDKGKEREENSSRDQDGGRANAKSYALRSSLPSNVIAAMSRLEAGLGSPAAGSSHSSGAERDAKGSLIDWKRADGHGQLGQMGLLHLVLSIILLNGRTVPDDQLRAYLKRLYLEPHLPLPQAFQSEENPSGDRRSTSGWATQTASRRATAGGKGENLEMTLEGFLSLAVKNSYLERVKTDHAATAGGAGARAVSRNVSATQARSARGMHGEMAEDTSFEWRWGSRAESEIGEKAVAKFVSEVFNNPVANGEEDDGEEREEEEEEDGIDQEDRARGGGRRRLNENTNGDATNRSRRSQLETQTLRNIERAAGSQLVL